MNKLIIVMSLSISYSLSAGILNSIGSIDKHTQFSLYFNSETNSGLVEIRNKLGTAEQYPIQCVDVEGDSPILANNNLKITIEKGIFFIPRRYSAEKSII